ncbi:ATPase, AAA family [Myxococcus xanthus DK 1622]|uniref:Replication-associated recombination protein A n=1 Tax=Myxococcus xanthus (strain DK1622) TaxID=246197 RepID=Q1D8G6_MYXXD|nr:MULTISPECIES: replication-associated recombination protein A [Myxococcus]ABF90902.1 ATPase, AAA family [Myxococcus xanthus DK 1622]NOJ55557.1 replication-associated recombination protein A [Myxococcus xanthus]QPM82328.1 replication-associated recombination protein A [Myxococcus xanthus]QVW71575.1 replication-associated recombination protein A [Myxococcus xanthus DZ2]QZZ50564.1 Replication-associated recombination protein A [Myxococcus xanthus]
MSAGPDLFSASVDVNRFAPLAERMRPRTPDEFIGQSHLLGPGRPLRQLIERKAIVSSLFWGPPGVGKTTLARMMATGVDAEFVILSAVSDGIPRIREVVAEAERLRNQYSRRTVLFVDEIHRWAKNVQEQALPHVESGLFVLLGATTENVSFEVRPALVSRCRVFQLKELTVADIQSALTRALGDSKRGLGARNLSVGEGALTLLAKGGVGDVRKALGALELAASLTADGAEITPETAREAVGTSLSRHDKDGDQHYDLLSALQKSCRGSNVQGAVFWAAKLLQTGDVASLWRRLKVIAVEDVGMAMPEAISVVRDCEEAFHAMGMPEGRICVAHAVVLLATAKKSNRAYAALDAALAALQEHPNAEPPLHIRNAPTELMKELGHGKGYQTPWNFKDHYVPGQTYLPAPLERSVFYRPSKEGYEAEIHERMSHWWREDKASRGE